MSLERRLLLGIALSLVVVFGLLLGGAGLAVRQLTEAYVYARLSRDAEALLATLRPGHGGELQLRERRLSPVYSQPLSGHYYVVLGSGGEPLRSRSLWDETLEVAPLAPGATAQRHLAGPAGQELLVHAAGFSKHERNITVAVAEDIAPLARQIRSYQLASAGVFLLVLLLLLVAQRRVVRAALARLDQLRAEVRRIGSGEQRALSEAVPLEVRPLVREFNRLLQLLDQRLARSRNAMGNLAHALKTPLSLLTGELERSAQPNRELTLGQTARIRQLVERELRRARIAGAAAPGRAFEPAADIPALLESLRRLHRDRELDLQAPGLPADPLPVDREDMLELLGNLLDNACKWAQRRVRLQLARTGNAVGVTVEDDGPGVAETDMPRLTARGTRIDESIQGHGLGLAIVGDIVRIYGGQLEFSRAPQLGGLRVAVSLPLEHGAAET
jgi:signal transduction histidine kinase